MIADAARIAGGPHVAVTALMGPGVDPHLYVASRQDQKRLHDADLVLYHGLHLEGKMADYLTRLRESPRAGQLVVAVAEVIPESELFRNQRFSTYPDPHVWFDLRLWKAVVAEVVRALRERDPPHARDYDEAGARYMDEIDAAHAWALGKARELSPERRRIVTSHDAYSYFARAYGFEVRGLQGISTETQPGLQNIRDAVAYIRRHGVPVVFAETSVRRDAVEQVAAAAGCRVCEKPLYSDALGEPGSGAESFLGMFRYNLATIVEALDSDASSP
jgi:manganese/zinc/iron transport system substrate-binding protein